MQPDLPTGVVLDEPEAHALLCAAVEEGLADENLSAGDGLLARAREAAASREVLDHALEQLVIGGRVYAPFPIPQNWHGSVFESGQVVGCEWDSRDADVAEVSPDVILQMLTSRGYKWSKDQFSTIVDDYMDAVEQWTRTEGRSLDAFEIGYSLKGLGWYDHYSPEQIAAAERLENLHDRIAPVRRCINDYSYIINLAARRRALSSLPMATTSDPLVTISDADADSRMAVLNVVCDELGTMPRGTNLRGTLELAGTDEAAALRLRLNSWVTSIRNADERLTVVRDEVEYARRQLSTKRSLDEAGSIYTAIGLPLLAASATGSIIVAALGATVTVASVVVLGLSWAIAREQKWAMIRSDRGKK